MYQGNDMSASLSQMFSGFTPAALEFLMTLHGENSRAWFQENKDIYQEFILHPLQALVLDLTDTMLAIDPQFEVRPLVDKTISRIYRDTRFSRDKSLYKETMWITFKRPIPDWQDAPVYFFEFSPYMYRYGMGYYAASRATMDRFREAIESDPDQFKQIIAFYFEPNAIQLEGGKYKRPIANDLPEKLQDWYQRKSFYLVRNREIDDLFFSPELIDAVHQDFQVLTSLYKFLMGFKYDL